MPRAITYKQLTSFKAKNMVKLLLKYRDYQNAITLVEQLDKKKLLSGIYEDWCACQLQHGSLQDQNEISKIFQAKFAALAEKLALD
jgi:hypothetical protein